VGRSVLLIPRNQLAPIARRNASPSIRAGGPCALDVGGLAYTRTTSSQDRRPSHWLPIPAHSPLTHSPRGHIRGRLDRASTPEETARGRCWLGLGRHRAPRLRPLASNTPLHNPSPVLPDFCLFLSSSVSTASFSPLPGLFWFLFSPSHRRPGTHTVESAPHPPCPSPSVVSCPSRAPARASAPARAPTTARCPRVRRRSTAPTSTPSWCVSASSIPHLRLHLPVPSHDPTGRVTGGPRTRLTVQKELMLRNQRWAKRVSSSDPRYAATLYAAYPSFFPRHYPGQRPEILWIGCELARHPPRGGHADGRL
jgi:hypothetical protein